MGRFRLERDKAALLVVDVQDRLAGAMDPAALERTVQRTRAAIIGAQTLGLPVVVTEQYPKGMGPTVASLREVLGEFQPIEKLNFSCALDEVLARFAGRQQVILTGMETHICVFQTVRDLAERKWEPWVCADAVLSRTAEDRRVGLDLCREAGGVLTTVESALFDLLGKAGGPEFKAISAAVK